MSLICRAEHDEKAGTTLTIENHEGKIIQTINLSGEIITTTCQGANATSVITQSPDSVQIKCNKFEVDSKNITGNSKIKTDFNSTGTLDAKSTENMNLDSVAMTNILGKKVNINQ